VLLRADAGAQQVFTGRQAIAEEQEKLNLLGFYGQNGKPLREDGVLDQDTLLAWNDKTYGGVLLGSNNSPMAKAQREWEKGKRKTDGEVVIERLNEILDRQYSDSAPVDLWEAVSKNRPFAGISASADLMKNLIAFAADIRMNNAFAAIDKNRDAILETASRFNIPAEVIASVILKEQYTQSLPDGPANLTTAIAELFPALGKTDVKIFDKLFRTHSMGLGAIFPETAREAWAYVGDQEQVDLVFSKDNLSLQKLLTENEQFNILTIGAVLAQKAATIGMIDSVDDLGSLSYEDWQKVLVAYNGGKEYGEFVREYLPYMRDYLRLD